MPNPVLDPKRFSQKVSEAEPGWGAPTSVSPAPDTVSPWPPAPTTYETMTIGGVASAVFLIMLGLFAAGRIVVTEKLRLGIITATGAVLVVYVLSAVVRLFGGDVGFIHDGGSFGILFSLVVVGIASMNLLLDFDF